jgi:3-oxoacyl-[acyl-carrier protein] reductase
MSRSTMSPPRPSALVTGVGRRAGIGAAVAERLLRDGFDVGCSSWSPYDERMEWGADPTTPGYLREIAHEAGGRTASVEVDLSDPSTVALLFERISSELGPVSVLVMSHCESVNSSIESTSLESFDRHFAVNARATWLLIREFARRFEGPRGLGRIIALTSDHAIGNLPYGASKGALDRIVLAATRELSDLGVTSNVINPGPTDTGWMTDELKRQVEGDTPLGRLGAARDAANLVSFLCSEDGGWINGQLLVSDGGISTT